MKHTLKRGLTLVLAALLLCALVLPVTAGTASASGEALGAVTILFTHDTHDHFYPDTGDVGGFVRLATLLDRERGLAAGTVFTLDAGDFSMGSPFQTVYATDAPELRALGAMGYDVTTFGNHEYDFRPEGLASMLRNAKASGDPLPKIVQANYKTPKADYAKVAVEAMNEYPVTDYTVVERDGIRIGVFGLVGVDSDECTPMSGMAHEPIADAAKRVVAELQAKENVDYIIALSHSGTEGGKGEDYELAKEVDGIDLIISGHTHTTLPEPIVVNDTYIASCGPYTQNLGRITLHKTGGKAVMEDYALIPIDSSIPADPEMEALCEVFKGLVSENYLSNYGYTYDQVLASSDVHFTEPQTGDYIGYAFTETVRDLEGDAYVPVAFAVCPEGVIRDEIRPGNITTADAFNILSLGVGADGTPGYPLISIYLSGKDLKNSFEVDASVSALMSGTALYGAGSQWSYNKNRMFLDKVTGSRLVMNGTPEKIEDNKLYRVVADLYSGQMLSTVKAKSFGLLSITPVDENGVEITDIESCIIHDADGKEVKAWYALAYCLEKEGKAVPAPASKTVEASWNPVKLLVPMGKPTLLVLVVILVLIALIVFIIYRIATHKKRKARKLAKRAAKKAAREAAGKPQE